MGNNLNHIFSQTLKNIEKKTLNKNSYFFLYKIWRDISGEVEQEYTDGIYLVKDSKPVKLIVYVMSAQWAQEFKMNKNFYLARLKVLYKNPPFQDIDFVVTKNKMRKRNNKEQDVVDRNNERKKPELSNEEINYIENLVSEINNESVREAAKKASKSYFKWKKENNNSNPL